MEAQGDLDTLRDGIERWYNSTMDRLSGEYKRSAQAITFLVGFAVAILCNVDTVRVVRTLYAEPSVRAALQTAATAYVAAPSAKTSGPGLAGCARAKPSAAGGAPVVDLQGSVAAASAASDCLLKNAPVGWPPVPDLGWSMAHDVSKIDWPLTGLKALGWTVTVLGWIVTALAGMLGAPFWFDMLQKIVNIRNAGPKPASASSIQPSA